LSQGKGQEELRDDFVCRLAAGMRVPVILR
jgi:hypothetical protein